MSLDLPCDRCINQPSINKHRDRSYHEKHARETTRSGDDVRRTQMHTQLALSMASDSVRLQRELAKSSHLIFIIASSRGIARSILISHFYNVFSVCHLHSSRFIKASTNGVMKKLSKKMEREKIKQQRR